MSQPYKNSQEVQQDLQDIKEFLRKAIEEDFPPLKVTMFIDFDLVGDKFEGDLTASNNILYSFVVTTEGQTTLTRK